MQPMANAIAIDKDQVRMLVLTHGVREAARMLSLPQGTVQAWSARGNWLQGVKEAVSSAVATATAALPASMRPKQPPQPVQPVDALAQAMADQSKRTRKNLAQAAENWSEAAKTAPLEQAGAGLQAAKVASLVHRWEAEAGGSQRGSVSNITIEGGQVVINQLLTEDVEC